jgi:hypothetical protein
LAWRQETIDDWGAPGVRCGWPVCNELRFPCSPSKWPRSTMPKSTCPSVLASNMPQPLLAVGLATAILQTIDFAVNILSENRAIYPSSDGASPDNQTVLRDITNNFHRLSFRISENDVKRRGAEKKNAKLSEAEQHLLKMSEEMKELVDPLRDAFFRVQPRGSYSDPNWGSAREALLTVWKEKEMIALAKRLNGIKKDVDTALLSALR